MTTYAISPNGLPLWKKDPSAVKDYQVDWTAWLAGDNITAHAVTAAAGITIDASSASGAVVTIWLSGGTHGQTYKVTCEITTAGGRVEQRSFEIEVRDQ